MAAQTTVGPTIRTIEAIPVAGHDSMLMNLSGAHGPFCTRNLARITDSDGRVGIGEVPGGEAIRSTTEDAAQILTGQPVTRFRSLLREVHARFAARDAGGRGSQTFELSPVFGPRTRIRAVRRGTPRGGETLPHSRLRHPARLGAAGVCGT